MRTCSLILILAWASTAQAEIISGQEGSLGEQFFQRGFGPFSSENVQEIPELSEALEQFEAGNLEGCLELLNSAREERPNLPPGRLLLARLLLLAGRIPQARLALEQSAAEEPEYSGIYLTFGELALAEGRITDASLQYRHALSIVGSVPDKTAVQYVQREANAGLATVAERRGDWETACQKFSTWLAFDPRNAEVLQRYARALYHADDPDAALTQFKAAFEIDDSLQPPEVAMAWLSEQQGDRKVADTWIESALETPTEGLDRHVAAWMLHTSRFDQAADHAEAAQKANPEDPEVLLLCGQVERARKNLDAAEKWFRDSRRQNPNDVRSGVFLALTLVDQDDRDKRREALQIAESMVREHPDSTDAVAALGHVYYEFGRLDEAGRMLEAALRSGMLSSRTAYFAAQLLADRGRLDEARGYLQSAVEADGYFEYRDEAAAWLQRIAPRRPDDNTVETTDN